MPIIGGNGFNNPRLMADAGEAAEGVVVGAAWNSSSDNPENVAFLEDFAAKFDTQPDQFAAQAYAGLLLVDHAVRANCSADRESIKEALGELEDPDRARGVLHRREPGRRPPGRRAVAVRGVRRPGVAGILARPGAEAIDDE